MKMIKIKMTALKIIQLTITLKLFFGPKPFDDLQGCVDP